MKTLLIVILVLAVVAGLVFIATKYFKAFKDNDKDGIPDVVEDKYKDVKEDVEDVFEDVKDKVEDVLEEVKDFPKKLSRKKPGRSKNKTNTVKPAPAKNTGGGGSSPETGNGDYYRTIRKAEK